MGILSRATSPSNDDGSALKIYLHGAPGTGKTTLGASFAEEGQKGLYIDFAGELGFRSLPKKTRDNVDRLVVREPDDLAEMQYELMTDTKYHWVLVDSATTMQSMFERYIHKRPQDRMAKFDEGKNFADGRQKWGKMLDHMTNVVTFYYDLADPGVAKVPKHVIFTAQSSVIREEDPPRNYVKVHVRGAGQSSLYAGADYVLYTYTQEEAGKSISGKDRKTKYYVRLGPQERTPVKIRRAADDPKLPSVVGGDQRLTLPKFQKLLDKVSKS